MVVLAGETMINATPIAVATFRQIEFAFVGETTSVV